MPLQISGAILTRDNERTIARAVRSLLPFISELIIVDDGSTDNTLSIIRELYPEVKVLTRKLDQFHAQRNFALERVAAEWVVMIDSDEEITTPLADAIQRELARPRRDLYRCYRLNEALGRSTKVVLDRPILFRKHLRFSGALHETIELHNPGFLPAELLHHSWVDVADWIDDINQYSTYQAKKWLIEERNYNTFQLALIALGMPLYHFCKLFFGQRRYRNGFFAGLVYPLAQAAEWWFVILKYYEYRYLQHAEKPADIRREKPKF
ncbi:MAG: glycosyltransferase family 2 protein [Candidatus Liptonbacteria bacterium]|nr:glycosyltransferase family 2 protein [Candidatus Liptonbacteria bacterium]